MRRPYCARRKLSRRHECPLFPSRKSPPPAGCSHHPSHPRAEARARTPLVARARRRARACRQAALLAELRGLGASDRSLVPDSPGPLSILRSLRPDRLSGGRAGEARQQWLGGSPRRAASPDAGAIGGGRMRAGRRGAVRRVVDWALSAALWFLALLLPLLLAARAAGGGGAIPMVV
jgi:hypothetical protein